jgi:response regulator RpfG family c-di-GMP phosphodiesterase
MNERVLCVDDDPNILQAYQRALRKQFILEPALGGEEALEAIRTQGPYAIVVADMRMPGMNGVELLAKIKEIAPDTVRMMLTGNADQQTALEAVNEGHIFRFLTKPCPPESLARALKAGIEQYRLIVSEKELLAKTLRGSIRVLTDILSLLNPSAFARASRVRRMVTQINKELQVDKSWLIEIAAMLSQIGCVAVPEIILHKVVKNEPLSSNERKIYESHTNITQSLLSHIPRLEDVAEIIVHQDDCYTSEKDQTIPPNEELPIGSRILKVALDWDSLVSSGMANNFALAQMNDHKARYDPKVLAALQRVLSIGTEYVIRQVTVQELPYGAILAEDICSIKGTLLCAKGQEVTPPMRARLKNYVVGVGIRGPIKIFVSAVEADVPIVTPDISVAESTEDTYWDETNTDDFLGELYNDK